MLAPLIAVLCAQTASTTQPYEHACNKAYEAASAQFGLDHNLDAFANHYAKLGEKELRARVNDQVAGAVVAAYAIAIDRKVRISTSDVPYVQSTVITLEMTTVKIVFSWGF